MKNQLRRVLAALVLAVTIAAGVVTSTPQGPVTANGGTGWCC